MSWLETILKKLMGEDKFNASSMLACGMQTKQENAPGHVWADYYFLAACYSSAAGDERSKKAAVDQIKETFPNYDPSTRFSMKDSLEAGFAVGRYKLPVVGQMNKFCNSHPDFSFGNALSEYFPSTTKMHIKQDTAPGLVKEKDEKYSINDNLEE